MITMDRKYQTRKDSLPVEILRNNVKNPDFPIVGIITFADGSQQQDRWMADGSYSGEEGYALDLMLVSTKHEGWGVIFSDIEYSFNVFLTREGAERYFHDDERTGRIVPVTWEG